MSQIYFPGGSGATDMTDVENLLDAIDDSNSSILTQATTTNSHLNSINNSLTGINSLISVGIHAVTDTPTSGQLLSAFLLSKFSNVVLSKIKSLTISSGEEGFVMSSNNTATTFRFLPFSSISWGEGNSRNHILDISKLKFGTTTREVTVSFEIIP